MRSELWDKRIAEIVAAGKGAKTCAWWANHFGVGYMNLYSAASQRNAQQYFASSFDTSRVYVRGGLFNNQHVRIGKQHLRAAGLSQRQVFRVTAEPGRIILTAG